MATDDLDDRARVGFFALGLDYYITGRFATFAGLFPMAGNLLHHAMEMFLKGALVRIIALGPLRDAGHDLNRLWGMFKTHMPCAEAASFHQPIAEVHRFERLRYPDTAIREGMEATLAIFRTDRVETSGTMRLPRYSLVLEDFDALAKLMFERAGVNPQFIFSVCGRTRRTFSCAITFTRWGSRVPPNQAFERTPNSDASLSPFVAAQLLR